MFGFSIHAQEKYTDEEIGFDKARLEKEISENEKLTDKEVSIKLEEIRKHLVEVKESGGFEKWLFNQRLTIPKEAQSQARTFNNCSDFTFDDGTLAGWCLCYNIATHDYNDPFCEASTCSVNTPDFLLEQGQFRFSVENHDDVDPWLASIDEDVTYPGNNVLKLGNDAVSQRKEQVSKSFVLNEIDDFIYYEYAIILEDPNHGERPFFSSQILINGNPVPCSRIFFEAFNSIPGFTNSPDDPDVKIKPWSSNIIRPSDFGAQIGDEITFIAQVADCGAGAHFGYAYFDIACLSEDEIIIANGGEPTCLNEEVTFTTAQEILGDFTWEILDSLGTVLATFENVAAPTYTFNTIGNYTVRITIDNFTTTTGCSPIVSVFSTEIEVVDCSEPCNDCYSFKPRPDENYVLSAWIKEDVTQQVKTYENSAVVINFLDDNEAVLSSVDFIPKGRIIEEWQRVYDEFTIPGNTAYIEIVLKNKGGSAAYFDDIRIHPYNGNMKSFVYDPETQRLMAELDENNYSTFYEYDKEGGLIRVKKETEKGVYTIQETRSKSSIKN